MIRLFSIFIVIVSIMSTQALQARVRIDITQGNVDPMPVAAPNFLGATDDAANLGRDITGVFMSDLDRSGLFQVIDQRAYIFTQEDLGVNKRPRFADWRLINAQVLVIGEVEELPDGRIQVSTRVWDVYSDEQLGAVAFIDAGQVDDEITPSFDNLAIGAGAGLRYYTDFGPLRFDVGVPLQGDENSDNNFQIYISIGQAF